VIGIDPDARRIEVVRREDGHRRQEAYDHLMVATGARPVVPDVPGVEAEGIFGADTLPVGEKIRRYLEIENPGRAVIVGGGYIGLEMAEAMLAAGLEVSLVEQADQVMNTLDADMAQRVSEALETAGVTLYLEEPLEGFEMQNGRLTAVATRRRELPADLAILGIGVRPNTTLAREAGIPLGFKDGIRVNTRMQTETPGIWAAGDCVESFHLVSRKPFYVALGTVANRQGRVAGINIGGGYATYPGALGTAICKVCDVGVARTGLQAKEIEALGLEYETETIVSSHRTGYYPDAGRVAVKILAEKGSGRLLGGQMVGDIDGVKRIDVLATALQAEFTVPEMIHLDLSYAPPFSPVWDPVLVAVRKIIKKY
jgi:NADPH-dependent 2,4-dienoyl-CoA reductase/sulfur reductase-like enzyme